MKKLYIFVFAILLTNLSFGQLTGIKNIPGDYATLTLAITDLNTQGVGAGGVTINLVAGHPQTAPAGGYVIGGTGSFILTTSGASQPVIIQGNNNTITAPNPQTSGNLNDAIFKIIGADWITITGFTMQENAANTNISATSNNMTEFGVALFYATQTDGAKNITIQNNTITLKRTYQNTFGIYSNVCHSASAVTTAADITNVSGANDNTHIYGNNISNVNNGIVIVGSLTGAFMNTGIDIGGAGTGSANTISNYGLTGIFSGYVSVSGSVMGINLNNCLNSNVYYNSITCPGLNTAGTVYGIHFQASGTLPVAGSFTNTLSHNTLAIKSGYGAGSVYGLSNTVGNAFISYDVSYNDFCNMGHAGSSPSGSVYCLYSTGNGNVQTMNYNTFTNLSLATTGSVYLLDYSNNLPVASSTRTVTNNSVVTGFSKTGAGGTVYGSFSDGSSVTGSSMTIASNNFSNITVTGATLLYGMYEMDGGSPNKSFHDNTVAHLTAGSGSVYGMNIGFSSGGNYYNNTVNTFSGSGPVTGITLGSGTNNFYQNSVYALSTSGASTLCGVENSGGTLNSIYRNNIYNLSGSNAFSIVYGIYVSSGTTINIYNNFIGDLRTPAANNAIPLAGIYIEGGTTDNVFYNTVFLAGTSSSGLFGSSALYASSTPTLDMRNNILINTCTPKGTLGFATAYRRSDSTITTYSNNSNSNCFYAGTPGTKNLIMYDGTHSYQDMTTYQAAVSPRDAFSFRELPPFVNAASTPYNLHMQTTVATYCESGGLPVTTPVAITDDYDGNTRSSVTPDAGADEFAGIAAGVVNPCAFTASVISSQQINLSYTLNPSGNNVMIVWNSTGTFTAPSGAPPSVGQPFAGGIVLSYGTASPVSHTGLTQLTTYYYKAFSYNGSKYSFGTAANATTPCPNATLNVTQGFNETTIPGCWSQQFVSGAFNIQFVASSSYPTTYPYEGTGFAYWNSYNIPSGNSTRLVSPPITTTGTGSVDVEFYWMHESGGSPAVDGMYVEYSTNGTTWNTAGTMIPRTGATTGWYLKTVTLPAGAGNQPVVYVGFRFVSAYGDNCSMDAVVIKPTPSCPAPTAVVASAITSNSAIISWTAPVLPPSSGYHIYYSTSSTAPASGTTPTGSVGAGVTSYPTGTVLTANTQYYVWVRSNCGSGLYSTWSSPAYSFTTPCSPTTVPFAENFDSYTVPSVGCGTVTDQNADGVKWATATGTPYNGPNSLHVGYSAPGIVMDDWYFTRGITLIAGQSYDVRFYYKGGTSGYAESLEVKLGNVPAASGMTGAAIFSEVNFYKASYTLGAGSFIPTVTGTYYAGWHCFSIPNQLGIDVDQITIQATPSCPAPLTVTATPVSNSGISVGWTGTPTTVEIDYGAVGHVAGTGIILPGVTLNPTLIGSLSTNTAYDVFVRQNCGSGSYSSWTGPVTVTTFCDAVSSFSENFDGVTSPELPSCWRKYTSPLYAYQSVASYSSGSNSSPNCVQLYNSGATLAENAPMLISPTLSDLAAGTNQLHFFAKGTGNSMSVIVGTLSDPLNSSTFTPFQTVTGLNSSTYTEKIVSFETYIGTDTYIAFQHPLTTAYTYIYIDNAAWEPLSPPKTLSLKVYLEGLYNTGTGLMNQAQGSSGPQFGTGIADKVTIELHDPVPPYDVAYTYGNLSLSNNGALSIVLPGTVTGSYYLVVKNRNHLETWSAAPVVFSGAGPIAYDFSTAASKAYGSNMKLTGSVYALWAGDITQDGLIDGSDMASVDNASAIVLTGYTPEDANGDGLVDGSDMAIIDNNSAAIVTVKKPE